MRVPDGWETKKLGKLAKTVTSGSRDWAQYYAESGSKFIRMTNLRRDGIQLKLDDLKYVNVINDSADGKRTALQNGDILISITAELGKIGWIPDDFGEAFINQHTALIRINQEKANSKFIAYLLSSKRMNQIINTLNDAGAKAGLNLPTIKEFKIHLPPLPEQQKIAQILSTWDKAIAKLEVLIAAKQKRKKALMQQLLTGRVRFPGFIGKWKEVHLSDIFQRVMRKNIEKHTNVVTISAQKGLIKQEEFFNKNVSSEILDHYFLIHKGEFAYNKSYSNGYPMGAIKRLNNYDKAVVTSLYICFAIKDESKSCGNFFEQYFESGRLINGLMKVANEGGRAHGLLNVTPKDFFELKLTVPDFKEQQKIATVLSAADNENTTHQNQLATLKQQKTGLMQQLLTGKIRVKLKPEELFK